MPATGAVVITLLTRAFGFWSKPSNSQNLFPGQDYS